MRIQLLFILSEVFLYKLLKEYKRLRQMFWLPLLKYIEQFFCVFILCFQIQKLHQIVMIESQKHLANSVEDILNPEGRKNHFRQNDQTQGSSRHPQSYGKVRVKSSKNRMVITTNQNDLGAIFLQVQQQIKTWAILLRSVLSDQDTKDITQTKITTENIRLIKQFQPLLTYYNGKESQKLRRLKQILSKGQTALQDQKKKQQQSKQSNQIILFQSELNQFLKTSIFGAEKQDQINVSIIRQLSQIERLNCILNKNSELTHIIPRIFSYLQYVTYFPTMVKATIAGINSLDKINKSAEIALKVEIKVNVPGFSGSVSEYEKLFRRLTVVFKTESEAHQFDLRVSFNKEEEPESGIKTVFYSNPEEFFEDYYGWKHFKVSGFNRKQIFQSFEGFILVAELNNVKVKYVGEDWRSPFELLDLRGVIKIEPLKVRLEDIRDCFYIKDKQIKQLVQKINPLIIMKFNMVSLYMNDDTKLNSQIIVNHISSFDNISKDGYCLIPEMMLLQTSNSHNSIFTISKNPCNRRWVREENYSDQPQSRQDSFIFKKNSSENDPVKDRLNEIKKYFDSKKDLNIQHDKSTIIRHDKDICEISIKCQSEEISLQNLVERIRIICSLQKVIQDREQFEVDTIRNLLGSVKSLLQIELERLQMKKQNLRNNISKFQRENKDFQTNQEYQSYKNDFNQMKKFIKKLKKQQSLKNTQKQQENDSQFNSSEVHYHFPVYRQPGHALILLFLSTNVLGIINLFIFYQKKQLDQRIGNLATLLVSFIGILSVMQSTIYSYKINLTSTLIYLIMLAPLLCLGYSAYTSDGNASANFDTPPQNPFFWFSVIVVFLNITVPITEFVIYKVIEKPKYFNNDRNDMKCFEYIHLLLPGTNKISNYINLSQKKGKNEPLEPKRVVFHETLLKKILGTIENVYMMEAQLKLINLEDQLNLRAEPQQT